MTVNVWSRWELAYPLMVLSLLLLVGNLFGMATWWSDESWSYRMLGTAFAAGVAPIRILAKGA